MLHRKSINTYLNLNIIVFIKIHSTANSATKDNSFIITWLWRNVDLLGFWCITIIFCKSQKTMRHNVARHYTSGKN